MSTYSIETRINDFLDVQKISAEFLVSLLPPGTISVSRLRLALRGEMALSNAHFHQLDSLLRELSALGAEHAPLAIRWENPAKFRELLAARREAPQALTSLVMEYHDNSIYSLDLNALLSSARV